MKRSFQARKERGTDRHSICVKPLIVGSLEERPVDSRAVCEKCSTYLLHPMFGGLLACPTGVINKAKVFWFSSSVPALPQR